MYTHVHMYVYVCLLVCGSALPADSQLNGLMSMNAKQTWHVKCMPFTKTATQQHNNKPTYVYVHIYMHKNTQTQRKMLTSAHKHTYKCTYANTNATITTCSSTPPHISCYYNKKNKNNNATILATSPASNCINNAQFRIKFNLMDQCKRIIAPCKSLETKTTIRNKINNNSKTSNHTRNSSIHFWIRARVANEK